MLSLTVEKTANLTAAQSRALRELAAHSGAAEADVVSYPQDEEDVMHYLLWIRAAKPGYRELAGALAVLPLDEDTVECIAVIHPSHRRKRYFSRLLQNALRDFSRSDFLFPVPGGSGNIRSCLEAVGARYDHTDYMMEYFIRSNPSASVSSFSNPADNGTKKMVDHPEATCQAPTSPALPEVFLWPEGAAVPIGSCRVVPLSADCVCLCQVEISPTSRGFGHGTAMIRSLLCQLQTSGIQRVILHVEKENLPAVALYKKTGFRVIETLSYCLLPSGRRTNH